METNNTFNPEPNSGEHSSQMFSESATTREVVTELAVFLGRSLTANETEAIFNDPSAALALMELSESAQIPDRYFRFKESWRGSPVSLRSKAFGRRLSDNQRLALVRAMRQAQEQSGLPWSLFMQLAVNTAVDPDALLAARWSEFNMYSNVWMVPRCREHPPAGRNIQLVLTGLRTVRELLARRHPTDPRVFHEFEDGPLFHLRFANIAKRARVLNFRPCDLVGEAVRGWAERRECEGMSPTQVAHAMGFRSTPKIKMVEAILSNRR